MLILHAQEKVTLLACKPECRRQHGGPRLGGAPTLYLPPPLQLLLMMTMTMLFLSLLLTMMQAFLALQL